MKEGCEDFDTAQMSWNSVKEGMPCVVGDLNSHTHARTNTHRKNDGNMGEL